MLWSQRAHRVTYSLIFHAFFGYQFHLPSLIFIDDLIEGVFLVASACQIKAPSRCFQVLEPLVDKRVHSVNLKLLQLAGVKIEHSYRRFILLDEADILAEVQFEFLLSLKLLFSTSGFAYLDTFPFVLHDGDFLFEIEDFVELGNELRIFI